MGMLIIVGVVCLARTADAAAVPPHPDGDYVETAINPNTNAERAAQLVAMAEEWDQTHDSMPEPVAAYAAASASSAGARADSPDPSMEPAHFNPNDSGDVARVMRYMRTGKTLTQPL